MRILACPAFACLALTLAWGPARTMAEALDPAQVEHLSVADARRLATEFAGATVEIPIRSGGRQKLLKALALPRLRSLAPEAAAALAEFNGTALMLDGLTELSPETAAALAPFTGALLSFNGLTDLSPETATAFASLRVLRIRLDGLSTLTPELAAALAGCQFRSLCLDGITSLSPEAAAAVAKFSAMGVSLAALAGKFDRATALTEDDADLLALVAARDRHPLAPSRPLSFGGIEALDGPGALETARILATVNRGLTLPNLKRLSPEAARLLAEFKGPDLELPALVDVAPAAAEALAACPARLVMIGLRRRFAGLEALTPDDVPLVRLMSREQVGVRLESLESLDAPEAVVTARTLAAATTLLALPRVQRISVAAARELSAFKGQLLVCDGLTELPPDVAEALAAIQVPDVRLNGLRELSPETAACLARCGIPHATDLYLDGLATITPEAARELAAFTGGRLSLNGLSELSSEAAAALAASPVPIACAGLSKRLAELDAVTADETGMLMLAARQQRPILLKSAATVDSAETAAMLAALPVKLVLPALRRISPRTMTALIAKEDVLVPRIESIEFVAEPDGVVTEDFVIPEGFAERQEELWGPRRRP